jgi:hypothetical protein
MNSKFSRIALILFIGAAIGLVSLKYRTKREVIDQEHTMAGSVSLQRTKSIVPESGSRVARVATPKALLGFTNEIPESVSKSSAPKLADQKSTADVISTKDLTQTPASQKKSKKLEDPIARIALARVGADWDAEAYWAESIFDPSLPDKEREDLMEDLNEEGFIDPHHPAPDELPLILARLQLIEEIAPAADEFMRPHLAEAYKDLVNMLDGRGPQ